MVKASIVIPKGQEAFYDQFHFAPAVKDGDRLFCSGVIGVAADGKASPDPETQFTQAFESLSAVLKAAGASFADVVEMTTFHVDLRKNLGKFMKGRTNICVSRFRLGPRSESPSSRSPGASSRSR